MNNKVNQDLFYFKPPKDKKIRVYLALITIIVIFSYLAFQKAFAAGEHAPNTTMSQASTDNTSLSQEDIREFLKTQQEINEKIGIWMKLQESHNNISDEKLKALEEQMKGGE